ncbi:MAG: glycosyltransferase [Bacteroidaceae bacterium]|nr:glycosyltransferase [Bacteroidaceae bacterium]
MGNPLVSIVMPVYNTGPFLREAIESVLAQTRTDWELIVVDDGSTDDSAAIVSSYPDPRIRLIAQQNAGQSVARNTAMQVAKGDFVYCIDSDDVIVPNLLEVCLHAIGENDFLFFNADTIGADA